MDGSFQSRSFPTTLSTVVLVPVETIPRRCGPRSSSSVRRTGIPFTVHSAPDIPQDADDLTQVFFTQLLEKRGLDASIRSGTKAAVDDRRGYPLPDGRRFAGRRRALRAACDGHAVSCRNRRNGPFSSDVMRIALSSIFHPGGDSRKARFFVPNVHGILETALYVRDLQRSAAFYRRLFDFPTLLDSERLIALDVAGRNVLLLFKEGATSEPFATPGGVIPGHGGAGANHFAFSIALEDFGPWQIDWMPRPWPSRAS